MIQFYHIFFAPTGQPWESGSVWSNMVAWVICGVFAIVWGRRKIIKWDKKRKEDDERHHQELKAHITVQHELSRKHLEQTIGKRKSKE